MSALPRYHSDVILNRSYLLIQLIVPLYVFLQRSMLDSSCWRSKPICTYNLLSSAPGKNQNVSNLNTACLPEAFSTVTLFDFIYLSICIRFPWHTAYTIGYQFPTASSGDGWAIMMLWFDQRLITYERGSIVWKVQQRHYQAKSALKNKHLARSVCLPTGLTFQEDSTLPTFRLLCLYQLYNWCSLPYFIQW